MTVDFKEQLQRADRLRNDGKTREAVALYEDLAVLAAREGRDQIQAEALHNVGNTLRATIGRGEESVYRQSLEYFGKAVLLYKQEGDQVGLGAVLRDIGIAADRFGDYSGALASFQQSIELLSTAEAHGQLAITYDKLGLHFIRVNQPQNALPYFEKASDFIKLEPTAGFFGATILLDKAKANLLLGKFEDALNDAETSLSWFEADHGGENYYSRRTQLHGLLVLILIRLGNTKSSSSHKAKFDKLIKLLDIDTASVVKADLDHLARAI